MSYFESGPNRDPYGVEIPVEDPFEALEVRAAQLNWNDPTEVARFEIDLYYAQEEAYDPDDSPFYEPHDDYERLEAELRWKANRYASPEQRLIVFRREEGHCHYCSVVVSFNGFQADHKTPYSKGGETALDNLVCACYSCNKAKFAMDYDEFVEKLASEGIEWRNQERDRVVALLRMTPSYRF
jgi:hypothetical protein